MLGIDGVRNVSINPERKEANAHFVKKNFSQSREVKGDFALLNADFFLKWKKQTHVGYGRALLIEINGGKDMEPFRWGIKIC